MGTGASSSKPRLSDDVEANQPVSWSGRPYDRINCHVNTTNGTSGKPPFTTSMVLPNPRVGPRLSSSPTDSPQPTLRVRITPASSTYTTLDRKSKQHSDYGRSLKDNLSVFSWDGSLKQARPSFGGEKYSESNDSFHNHRTRTISSGRHREHQQSKSELSDCPRIHTGERLRQASVKRWNSNPDTQRSLPRNKTFGRGTMPNSPNSINNNTEYLDKDKVKHSPKFHFRKTTRPSSHASDSVRSYRIGTDLFSSPNTLKSGSGYTSPVSLGSQFDSVPSTLSRETRREVPNFSQKSERKFSNPSNIIQRQVAMLKRPPSLLMSSKSKRKETKDDQHSHSDLLQNKRSSASSIKDIIKQERRACEILKSEQSILKPDASNEILQNPSKTSCKESSLTPVNIKIYREDSSLPVATDKELSVQLFTSDNQPSTKMPSAPKLRRSLRRSRLSRHPSIKPLLIPQSDKYSAVFCITPAYLLPYPITDKDFILSRVLRRFISQSLPFSRPILTAFCSAGLLSIRSTDSALLKEEGPIRARHVLERLHVSRNGLVHFNRSLDNIINIRSLPVPDGFSRSVSDIISCMVELIDILVECANPVDPPPEPVVNKSDSLGELRQELQKTVNRIFGPKPTVTSGAVTNQIEVNQVPSEKVFSIEVLYQTEEVSGSSETSADRLEIGYKMYDSEYTESYRPALTLELSSLRFRDEFWPRLGHILRKYNNISQLSLSGCDLHPTNLDALLGTSADPSLSLRMLNLRLNPLGDTGVTLLRAPRLPCLRHLNLACCSLSPGALWTSLPLLRRLHALDLGYNDLSGMPEPLLVRLCSLSQMRMLRLKNTSLSPGCLELLCDSLKRVRQLQSLDMSGHRLTRLNINSLSAGIASCGVLRELNVEQCNIVEDDCSILSKALLMNRGLEDLELSGNKCGDRGAALLATVVRDKLSLRSVSLNRCGLSKTGLSYILKAALTPTSKAISLHLAGNEFFTHQEYDQHFREILHKLNSAGKKVIL